MENGNMKTELVSGKLERVDQRAAGGLRFRCRGEKAAGKADQASNQAVDHRQRRWPTAAASDPEQRRIRRRELRNCPAACPAGFKAERILLVGLGKLTPSEVRKAAGAAVRFAKPRKLRELSIAIAVGGGARSLCGHASSGRRRLYRRLRSGYLPFGPERPEYRAAERGCR